MDTGDTKPFPNPASPNAGGYAIQYGLTQHTDVSVLEEKLELAMASKMLLLQEMDQQRITINEQARELTKIGEAIQTLKREKVMSRHELDLKCLELNQLKANFELVNKENQLLKTRDQMHNAAVLQVNELKQKLASEMEEKGLLMKQIESLQSSKEDLNALRNKAEELSEKLASETEEKRQLMNKSEEVTERENQLEARELAVQVGENRLMHLEKVMKHVHQIEEEVKRLQNENKDLRTKLHQKLAKTDKVGAQSLKMYQDKIEEMHKFNVKSVIKITNLEAQLSKLGNPNSTLLKPTVASRGKSSRPSMSVSSASKTISNLKCE